MTFYFKPPRGDIPLHRLQECIEERIRYLEFVKESNNIAECNESFKFEYLTDGSALDRTGHFMLRLIALKLNGLKKFVIEAESTLFEKRLQCLAYYNVLVELRTARRHAKEILSSSYTLPKYHQFLCSFSKLCEDIICSKAGSHTFVPSHSITCNSYKIYVPFTFCLPLIAMRDVELSNGIALIPCGKWTQLLSCSFMESLKFGMQQLSASNSYHFIWQDDRVRYLLRVLKARVKLPTSLAFNNTTILAKDINHISALFPPCMKNLHTILRIRHRLSHYSRFYYSLFLKDAGMSLMESVEFWSQEYSQANAKCTSCSHSWQRDNKRYVYSLRHMYGLEGSRRQYDSPHCQQIQEMSLGPSSEGGCPFLNFDDKKLLNCLHDKVRINNTISESLIQVKNKDGPKKACKMYLKALKCLMNQELAQESVDIKDILPIEMELCVLSPLQFYSNASELMSLSCRLLSVK